jgi:hypothetical protein
MHAFEAVTTDVPVEILYHRQDQFRSVEELLAMQSATKAHPALHRGEGPVWPRGQVLASPVLPFLLANWLSLRSSLASR